MNEYINADSEAFGASGQPVLEWPIPLSLLHSPAVKNRNLLARAYAARPLEDVLSIYVGMSESTARNEFGHALRLLHREGFSLAGTGVELGAGIGIFSAIAVSVCPDIDKIYAVELVPDVTKMLQPRVVAACAGERAGRVVPVVGSFDDMRVEDGSCDFSIEYASLHHSQDLATTLRETARLLKKGAPLVAIDRSHTDKLSEAQRRFMLDVQYSAVWKQKNGYSDAPLTRADNGEHELRLSEWQAAFDQAGFELVKRIELRPVTWTDFRRKAQLSLPFFLRKAIDLLPSRVAPLPGELFWLLKALLTGKAEDLVFCPAPREHTVFVAVRR